MKDLIRRFIVSLITVEARAILAKYKPKIILVTGSVGKTSTKDAIYAALSKRFFVRRSEKSFNSDIGVPLTILGVPNGWSNPLRWMRNLIDGALLLLLRAPYPEWLILEVGADRPGDISKSLAWLAPELVVATRFPDIPVHVEFYSTPGEVVKEELSPVALIQSGGALIANGDDENALGIALPGGVVRMTYGFENGAEVRASGLRASSADRMPTGIAFDVSYKGSKVHVVVPGVAGKGHAYAALAGIAVALRLGMGLAEAAKAVSAYEAPPGRMRLIAGFNGSTLIDDTYNASPVATEEALGTLCNIPRRGRRIAVLADMLELGMFSVGEHKRIGGVASKSVDLLVTVGVRGRGIAEGAREAGMPEDAIHECERGADAASYLVSLVQPGDVVLLKGSQSMRMERVTKSLMARAETAPQMLARQDAEWMTR
jgi:UDP-N-acetylmuramoyl-tripeptide--D-alanyl-D-alanine ligase